MKKRLGLAGVFAALALSLAACGSSGNSNAANQAAPQSAPAGQPNAAAFAKLQACLSRHGVTLPAGGPQSQPQQGSQPSFNAKTRKAILACSQYMPAQPQGG
jgi:hypothetical protein